MLKKKLNLWLPLLFALVMSVGIFLGYKMRDAAPLSPFFSREHHASVQEITDLLKAKYVDSVDVNALTDTAIRAMLSKLDPHTVYIPATELQDVNDEMQGSFSGIGVEFELISDSLYITNVLAGGPADKAGLKDGDIILMANDSIISGHKPDIERMRSLLRGTDGSKVIVSILRMNKKQSLEITRGSVPITSVDVAYMPDSTTGYIRLNKFSEQTHKEFMESLESLKKQGMKNLILDLRGNGGGVLEESTEVADEFLAGDKLITYTEGLHSPRKEYRCHRVGEFESGKLVLLADEGTASASEVLLGALQDWDRATIVGRRTFGKGLVQEQFNLSDNGALRLTIARYFTPLGRSIQRPYTHGSKAYYEEVANRMQDGEMLSADSVKNDTAHVFHSPAGKKLFARGGISPDYFVPADSSRISLTGSKLYGSSALTNFGFRYKSQHEAALQSYKTIDAFVKDFHFSETDWQYFSGLAAKDSVDVSKLSPAEKTLVEGALKSAIARQLFHNAGFFEALNENDNAVKVALQLIHNNAALPTQGLK